MVGLGNPIHLVFLLIVLLLVFGAKRLPEMGRSLGSGLRGFKEAIDGEGPAAHAEMTAATADPAMATSPEGIETLPVERIETRTAA